ncbi:hypothetical protein ARMGADRAFT_1089217 [Armillaria gallica]|uniref:Uncharacterized protein n=1 Tax=Armillaria gallica TaxID=47427 RepID=A0A2H3CQC3_ARMGA|nr:hypothetical protein ARMGADRAFT_1089217 [Armillaria gallica]
MPALDTYLKVARLAEAAGDSVPYIINATMIAVVIFKLLDQKGKNKVLEAPPLTHITVHLCAHSSYPLLLPNSPCPHNPHISWNLSTTQDDSMAHVPVSSGVLLL